MHNHKEVNNLSIGINFTPNDSLPNPNAANTVEILTPDVMKQGDTFNEVRVRLKRKNVNVDLANVDIVWSAAGAKGTVITDRPVTIHENGEVSFGFTEEDKGAWGTLRVEFKVTHSGTNKIEKFPANDHVRLHVTRSHDDLSHTPVLFSSLSYFNAQVEAAAQSAFEASQRALLVEAQGNVAEEKGTLAENAAQEAEAMAFIAENAAQEASAAKTLAEDAALKAKIETEYIVGKRPLIEQSITDAADAKVGSASAVTVAGAAKATAETVQSQFNQVVAEAGSNNPEVVQARGGEVNLNKRLVGFASQLADKLKKGEVSVSDIDKNKGKFDQTYMSDEFLQQVTGDTSVNATPAANSITSGQLTRKSVTAYETDFINVSSNLFNKDDVLLNYGIDTVTGDPVENTTASLSPFIAVKADLYYTVTANSRIAFYDDARKFISSHINSSSTLTVKAPSNAYFCRLVVQKSNLPTAQLNEGNVLVGYEDFYQELSLGYIRDRGIPNEKLMPINTKAFADRSMTPIKTTFFNISSNLFNKGDVLLNYGINTVTGEPVSNANTTLSEFIPVLPNTAYTFKWDGTSASGRIAYYDKNKMFISSLVGYATYTTPPNCYFVRMVTQAAALNSVQMNEGLTTQTYEPFYIEIDKKYLPVTSDKSLEFIADIPVDFYLTGEKPDAQGGAGSHFNYLITKAEDVYAKFDALVAANPDYITRTLRGFDASGTFPVYQYDFNPERPNYSGTASRKKFPKVLLTCGVHGNSDTAIGDLPTGDPHMHIFSLYYFFEDLCNKWTTNESIEYLRWYMRFSIIPIANPWGMNNNSRANYNNVDINRNFDYGWTSETNSHKGSSPFSEVESQYIRDFINDQKDDDVVVHMDYHCIGGNAYVSDGLLLRHLVSTSSELYTVSERAIGIISRKWKGVRGFVNDLNYYGRIDVYSASPMVYQWVDKVVGIPSMTIEAFRQTNKEAELQKGQFSSETIEMNVEGLANWIMVALRYFKS